MGEMDGCGQFMKYSLFFANFVIFVGGLVVFGIGIWTIIDKSFINELLGTNLFMGVAYIIIATGALVALIAFFGCLGAVKEIKCMLLTYALLLLMVLVVMLVGGILGYVFREKVRHTMEQEMFSTIKLYNEKRSIRRAWDDTQENLHCCGVNHWSDWKGNIPDSCCREQNGKVSNTRYMIITSVSGGGIIRNDFAQQGTKSKVNQKLLCKTFQTPLNTYTNGCLNTTEDFVKEHASIIAGAAITVSCLMVFGIVFALAMFKLIGW